MAEFIDDRELWENLMYVGSPFAKVRNHQGESLRQILERIPRSPVVALDEYGKLYAQCSTAMTEMADAQRWCRMLAQENEELRKELKRKDPDAAYEQCTSGYCIDCFECEDAGRAAHDVYICTGHEPEEEVE